MKTAFTKLLAVLGLATTTSGAHAIEADLSVGKPLVVEAPADDGRFGVVFEDDGATGYFYALDLTNSENPIEEAVSIYDVAAVTDRDRPSKLTIRWSPDRRKAGLWINGYPHAVFDFAAKRGYCRSNFPGPGTWTSHDFAWDDAALDFFR